MSCYYNKHLSVFLIQLQVKQFGCRVGGGAGETHLSEEHRQDSQADPVDDTGKLEGIINCRGKAERTTGYCSTE